jgi:hypothetical protein
MGSGRAFSTPSPIAKICCRFAAYLGCVKLSVLDMFTTLRHATSIAALRRTSRFAQSLRSFAEHFVQRGGPLAS